MQIDFFNAVWRTLKKSRPEKKRRKAWVLLKWVIQIAVWIWRALQFFFDEGGPP